MSQETIMEFFSLLKPFSTEENNDFDEERYNETIEKLTNHVCGEETFDEKIARFSKRLAEKFEKDGEEDFNIKFNEFLEILEKEDKEEDKAIDELEQLAKLMKEETKKWKEEEEEKREKKREENKKIREEILKKQQEPTSLPEIYKVLDILQGHKLTHEHILSLR